MSPALEGRFFTNCATWGAQNEMLHLHTKFMVWPLLRESRKTHTYTHAHAYTRAAHIHTGVCTHTHTHAHTCMHTHACTHILAHTYTHTHTHARARTHAHTGTHAHTAFCPCCPTFQSPHCLGARGALASDPGCTRQTGAWSHAAGPV